MNSVDKHTKDKKVENLSGAKAAEKIKELTKAAETCFFTTNLKTGAAPSTRPMTVLQADEQGNLWFLSSKDSDKNTELVTDAKVQLYFQGSKNSEFLSIFGTATITYDKDKIKELWNPLAKVWFTEGVDDPRISVIKVEPIKSHYWDTQHGEPIAFIKMATGLLTGQTLDDGVEGDLKV